MKRQCCKRCRFKHPQKLQNPKTLFFHEAKKQSGGGGAGEMVRESYVVVHNIAKRHNVGTLARSATAFGVKELILVGRRDFNSFGSHGSTSHLPFRHFHSLSDARDFLKVSLSFPNFVSFSRFLLLISDVWGLCCLIRRKIVIFAAWRLRILLCLLMNTLLREVLLSYLVMR